MQGEIGLADCRALRKVLGNVTSSHVTSDLSLCPSHNSSVSFHKRSLRVSRPDALCPVSCSALSTAEAATARAHSHTHGLDSVTPSPHIGLANDGGGSGSRRPEGASAHTPRRARRFGSCVGSAPAPRFFVACTCVDVRDAPR